MQKTPFKYLKNFLNQYKISNYLQGPIVENFSKPKHSSESGFATFITKKPSILKILIDKKFKKRFDNEIFVYQTFSSLFPEIKTFLPKLLSITTSPIKSLEIEFLKNYYSIGSLHETKIINKTLLERIIKTIKIFHKVIPDRFREKLDFVRGLSFFEEKLLKKDTGKRLKKFLKIEPKTIIKIFRKYKKIFEDKKFFALSDRNPTNIFIEKQTQKIKLLDFDRCGIGNPASDYAFLYISLIPKYEKLSNFFLENLNKLYNNQEFLIYFYLDTLVRLVDEYYWWAVEQKNINIAFKIKRNFFKIYGKINK